MKYVISFTLAIVLMVMMIAAFCVFSACTKDKDKQDVEPQATDEVVEPADEPTDEPTDEIEDTTEVPDVEPEETPEIDDEDGADA